MTQQTGPRTQLWLGAVLMAVAFGAGFVAGHGSSGDGSSIPGADLSGSSASTSAPPLTQEQLQGGTLPPGHPTIDPNAAATDGSAATPAPSGSGRIAGRRTRPAAPPPAPPDARGRRWRDVMLRQPHWRGVTLRQPHWRGVTLRQPCPAITGAM